MRCFIVKLRQKCIFSSHRFYFICSSSRRLSNQRIYATDYPKDQLVSNMSVKLDDDFHLEAALEAQTLEDVEDGEVDASNDLAAVISEVSLEDLELEKRFEEKKKKILEDILRDPNMDFPILRDVETMNWVGRNYVMLIMRGLPGSGKSTLVCQFQAQPLLEVIKF